MVFVTPALLGLLALAALLIALHAWRARHQQRMAPTTLLWQRALSEMQQRPAFRPPWRHLLLLAQLLALLLLVLAVAQPALTVAAPRRLIWVIDTSLQMGATDAAPTRLAASAATARHVLADLQPGDSVTLIAASAVPRVLLTSSQPAALLRAWQALRPALGQANLPLALRLAAAIAATTTTAHPSIALFTSFDTPLAVIPPALTVYRVGHSTDDQALSALSVRCPSASGGPCGAFARITNLANHSVADPLTVRADGQVLLSQTVLLAARSSTALSLSVPSSARVVQMSLARPDILAADNIAWAVLPRPSPLSVLVVSDDPTTLQRALMVLPGLSVTTEATYNYLDPGSHPPDVTIFDGFYPGQVAPTGSQIVLDPPADVSPFPYNGALSDTRPVLFNSDQPALLGVDLSPLVVNRADAASLPAWAVPLVASAAGPLIVAGQVSPTQRMVVTFFGLGDSNLAQLAAFPLLLRAMLAWLVPGLPHAATATPQQVPLLRGATRAVLVAPDGQATTLPLSASGLPLLPALDTPGVYWLSEPDGAPALPPAPLVVNAQPLSLPAPAPAAPAPRLPFSAALPALSALSGQISLVTWALLAALLVLSGEWWYYVRRT